MNRRIQVEELPSGELIISTNFVDGKPGHGLRFVRVCDTQYGAGQAVTSLLEHESEDAFQAGMRIHRWQQNRKSTLQWEPGQPDTDDEMPF